MTTLPPMRHPAMTDSRAPLATADEHASRTAIANDVPSSSKPAPRNLRRWWALFAILPFVTSVSGCGLMAAPCRVTSAGLKIIPGVGGVLAAPTDACAAAID